VHRNAWRLVVEVVDRQIRGMTKRRLGERRWAGVAMLRG